MSLSVNPSIPWLFTIIVLALAAQYVLTEYYPMGRHSKTHTWTFVAVSDADKASRTETGTWESVLQHGTLVRDNETELFSFKWGIVADAVEGETDETTEPVYVDAPVTLSTTLADKNRGMELSALAFYEGDLLAFCDRSGIMYQILPSLDTIVTTVLRTGDGSAATPFKTEWTAVKDDVLYMGSSGKEWVEDGEVKHHHHKWVKTFDKATRKYDNVDWTVHYDALREYLKTPFPGYMITEAGTWDARHKQWLFLPRKVSALPYDENTDELQGANILLLANADFTEISHVVVGPEEKDWGFSELQILPASGQAFERTAPTRVLALKVKEVDGVTESKIAVFDTTGVFFTENDGFYPVGSLDSLKFEGLSFVPTAFFKSAEELEVIAAAAQAKKDKEPRNFLRTAVDSVLDVVKAKALEGAVAVLGPDVEEKGLKATVLALLPEQVVNLLPGQQ